MRNQTPYSKDTWSTAKPTSHCRQHRPAPTLLSGKLWWGPWDSNPLRQMPTVLQTGPALLLWRTPGCIVIVTFHFLSLFSKPGINGRTRTCSTPSNACMLWARVTYLSSNSLLGYVLTEHYSHFILTNNPDQTCLAFNQLNVSKACKHDI